MKLLKMITMVAVAISAGSVFARGDSAHSAKDTTSQQQTRYNQTDIMSAQRALNAQGYNVSTDGVMGSETKQALRRFQSDKGIQETGTLDAATMAALNVNVGTPTVAPTPDGVTDGQPDGEESGRSPASVPTDDTTTDDTMDTDSDIMPDTAPTTD